MAYKSVVGSDAVARYVNETIVQETPVQKRLRAQTAAMPDGQMQISPDQGVLLAMLVRLIGANRTIEVGTFTGYSAMTVAAALPAEGKVVACDVSEEWTGVGKGYWKEAGVAGKIDLRIGPAQKTLEKLLSEAGEAAFDFAFIDADKEAYDGYYEACLKLIRSGGLIVLDNMLRAGKVADPAEKDSATVAIRNLSKKIRDDRRVDASLLTVGDGLMLARKR